MIRLYEDPFVRIENREHLLTPSSLEYIEAKINFDGYLRPVHPYDSQWRTIIAYGHKRFSHNNYYGGQTPTLTEFILDIVGYLPVVGHRNRLELLEQAVCYDIYDEFSYLSDNFIDDAFITEARKRYSSIDLSDLYKESKRDILVLKNRRRHEL